MSSEAATRAGDLPRPASARTLTDRFLAAVPLLTVFVWLAIVYAWEAWDHATPWLFTDELLLAQLGRSIAHTGHPSLRGEPYSFHSLYPVITAPGWWLPTAADGYAAVKYIGVFAVSLTIFPAYLRPGRYRWKVTMHIGNKNVTKYIAFQIGNCTFRELEVHF